MNKNRLRVYLLEFISIILIALNICIFGWFMAHSIKAVDLSYKSSFGIIRIILPSLATILFLFMIIFMIINLTIRKNKKYVFSIHFIHPLIASMIWFISNILVVVSLHTMNSRYISNTLDLESFLKMNKVFTFSYYIMFMCSSMLVISVILLLYRVCFNKEETESIGNKKLEYELNNTDILEIVSKNSGNIEDITDDFIENNDEIVNEVIENITEITDSSEQLENKNANEKNEVKDEK